MTTAYVFVQVSPDAPIEGMSTLREIEGVVQAHAVLGPIDAIAYVETEDLDTLWETISAIRTMEGITRIDTRLAWPF
jgi:nitrate reductase NapAB chaperone NapD